LKGNRSVHRDDLLMRVVGIDSGGGKGSSGRSGHDYLQDKFGGWVLFVGIAMLGAGIAGISWGYARAEFLGLSAALSSFVIAMIVFDGGLWSLLLSMWAFGSLWEHPQNKGTGHSFGMISYQRASVIAQIAAAGRSVRPRRSDGQGCAPRLTAAGAGWCFGLGDGESSVPGLRLGPWLSGHGAVIFQGMKTLKALVEWFSADRRGDFIFALSMLSAIGAMVAGLAIYRAWLASLCHREGAGGEPLTPAYRRSMQGQ
jgi:hypothetical protein